MTQLLPSLISEFYYISYSESLLFNTWPRLKAKQVYMSFTLNGDKLNAFPSEQDQGKGVLTTLTIIRHSTGSPRQCSRERK